MMRVTMTGMAVHTNISALTQRKVLSSLFGQINVSKYMVVRYIHIIDAFGPLDVSAIIGLSDYPEIGKFFAGFLKNQT